MILFDELSGCFLIVTYRRQARPVGRIIRVRGLAPGSTLSGPHVDIELPATNERLTLHGADFDALENAGHFTITREKPTVIVNTDRQPGFHPLRVMERFVEQ